MRIASSFALLGALALSPLVANAGQISWTSWNPASFVQTCPDAFGFSQCSGGTYYYPATASGTMSSPSGAPVTVSLTGQFQSVLVSSPIPGPGTYGPSWLPPVGFPPTFSGGTIGNAPPASYNSIQVIGGLTPYCGYGCGNFYWLDTLTFSSAVTNPVIAIWSLGAPGTSASFVFDPADPFTIQSGGPSLEWNGSSITKSGNVVTGVEGSGTIQFQGTYGSISFYTPDKENFYDFTVGSPVPEPSSLALLGTGLMVMVGVGRRKLVRKA